MQVKILSLSLLFLSITGSSAVPVSGSTTSKQPRQYNTFSISSGTGGTALAEVQKAFPGNPSTFNSTTTNNFNTEAHCAVLAENTFIAQIAANKNNATRVNALNVGMIKNKVLKIYGTIQALEGLMSKEDANITGSITQLQELQVKFAKNVGIDMSNAGKSSLAINFSCP